jgi:6-phosphogluconolactonase
MTSFADPSHLMVVADAEALAAAAAERVVERVRAASGPAAVCLTGGSTPQRLYGLLASAPFRAALPWERLHWFLTDERFVPADDARSNGTAARRALLDHVPVPAGHIHFIRTDVPTPEEAAAHYGAELASFYGADVLDPARPLFDLVLMGLGPDGHTASLFPGSPQLDDTERWATAVPLAEQPPYVPRVSLTFPALASSREMVFLVSGGEKHDALARIMAGENLPGRRAHTAGDLVMLADKAAAGRLHGR